jgi:DNA-binding NtrC family response regulator
MAAIPARVLLVDDDAGIRDLMAMLLATVGYEVSTAKHGFDALPEMNRKKPRL